MVAVAFGDIVGHHADLSPLRDRRRGMIRCPFHRDRTPSFSVDLDRGVFHCFGCGVEGGVKRFAELVGDVARLQDRGTPGGARPSPAILREARAQPWAREGVVELYQVSTAMCAAWRRVQRARDEAMRRGPSSAAWSLLAEASARETRLLALELEYDDAQAIARFHDVVERSRFSAARLARKA
ncbi:MAG: CHC2 zinc finger domain-containing protein [Candidatus Rokuibacteriota bacterium]